MAVLGDGFELTMTGDSELRAKLDYASPRSIAILKSAMLRVVIKLQRLVKENKLSGQVLHVRSERLRKSITYNVEAGPAEIRGKVGTNVKYAAPNEFGFDGPVNVRAHLRMQTMAWGKAIKEPQQVMVSTHTMHMRIPERSFLRSALKESKEEALMILRTAIQKELLK